MRLALAAVLAAALVSAALAQEDEVEGDVRRHVLALASEEEPVRRGAEDALVALGDAALPFLPGSSTEADPERADRLRRVERRIRWRLDRTVLEAIGGLFDGFEDLPFRKRVERLHDLVRFAGRASLPTLLAAAGKDPHPEVRAHARRLAGEVDLAVRLDEAQPAVAAKRWDEAARVVALSLEVDPEGPFIHYQIACYHSLGGRLDEAFASLERAVELGFTNFVHMEEDPELAAVRADPRFERLRARYED